MINYFKDIMSNIRKRRIANFKNTPHRTASEIKIDKDEEMFLAAKNFYRANHDEEIIMVGGFGLVHAPQPIDEETEQYLESLRKLGQ